jgi:putative DNA primase/helicase
MIGDARPAGKDSLTFYANADRKLYANYAEFCRNNNVGAQARSRFEANLIDILQNQLNLNISKNSARTVSLFNIKIRQYQVDEYYPSLVELALNPDNYVELYGNVQVKHH